MYRIFCASKNINPSLLLSISISTFKYFSFPSHIISLKVALLGAPSPTIKETIPLASVVTVCSSMYSISFSFDIEKRNVTSSKPKGTWFSFTLVPGISISALFKINAW